MLGRACNEGGQASPKCSQTGAQEAWASSIWKKAWSKSAAGVWVGNISMGWWLHLHSEYLQLSFRLHWTIRRWQGRGKTWKLPKSVDFVDTLGSATIQWTSWRQRNVLLAVTDTPPKLLAPAGTFSLLQEIDEYKTEPIYNQQQELHPLAQFRDVQEYARKAKVALTGYGTGAVYKELWPKSHHTDIIKALRDHWVWV